MKWWYYHAGRNVGPFTSREEAASAAFTKHPKLRDVMTGYGNFGAHFDVQWPRNSARS